MATSVATPLIKQFATIAGIDSISTTNSLGLDLDRHPVRARPRYRRGRRRRAVGDRPHAARVAGRYAGAAELPQGQSGRRADPAAGAEERHRSADRPRRVRPAGDLAVAVDAERRGAGVDLRQPAIRGAHPARRGCAGRARHLGRPDPGGGRGRQPEHAGRHAAGQPAATDHRRRHAAGQCRRLLQAHHQERRRQVGAARRRHAGDRFRRQQPDGKLV